MEHEYDIIAELIRKRATDHLKKRLLIAIAGIPGAGTTTTVSGLAQRLNGNSNISARTALPSMDGFHLSQATLDQLPNRKETYIRRSTLWTFDSARFLAFVWQLRKWAGLDSSTHSTVKHNPEFHIIYAPTFDHKTKDPVDDAIAIIYGVVIIIIDGNYLLLNGPDWRDIVKLVDYRVFIDSGLEEALERVARKHIKAEVEKTLEAGFQRVDHNDYLNALTIKEKFIQPNLVTG